MNAPPRLRVVVAEDHLLVREGTCRLLEATGEVDVVAAVGSGPDLLEAVARLVPDAVITDIRMPPQHRTEGLDAAHAIRASHPGVAVVVLSQYADPSYATELLKHGAGGRAYLLKDRIDDDEGLLRTLREVVAGRSVIDPHVIEALVGQRCPSPSPLDRLTPRERDVLSAMAEGRTNSAIATALRMSESGVEKHVNAIFSKLDLPAEPSVHRRVTAVITHLRNDRRAEPDAAAPRPG